MACTVGVAKGRFTLSLQLQGQLIATADCWAVTSNSVQKQGLTGLNCQPVVRAI